MMLNSDPENMFFGVFYPHIETYIQMSGVF